MGGDLSPPRLISAYKQGIFPWFTAREPVLWWSPDPRAVLFPDKLHISRSLHRFINKKPYRLTMNRNFAEVIRLCAAPRKNGDETWITPAMITAYSALHKFKIAHSVEVWREQELVGGLYGVWLDRLFCAESMFRRADNASKIAVVHLVEKLKQQGGRLIDVQIISSHLSAMGAEEISRSRYLELVRRFTGNLVGVDTLCP